MSADRRVSAPRISGLATGLLALAIAGQPVAAQSGQGAGGLRAAFSRVDITPPPGLGLQGYGPEGREARGYRQRLYARALGLVDRDGERLAIVVVDLQAVSPSLHKESIRYATSANLEYHELLLAATHTHAAPSHYFDAGVFNENGSRVVGFDPKVLEFFAQRIALALDSVFDAGNLEPARAAWGSTSIAGVSRNRAYGPYLANTGPTPPGFPEPQPLAVDRTWTMLRVDTIATGGARYAPAGALSVFGVHPTVIPSNNDLYESDLHGYVSRKLERAIDGLAGISTAPDTVDPRPRSVHLWANGAEGDVSPAWTPAARCRQPQLRRGLRPSGARAPRGPDHWDEPGEKETERCISEALDDLRTIGDAIAAAAERLFRSLGGSLRSDLTISRAFRSLTLTKHARGGVQRLPDLALVGSALLGGAEDGRTRYYRWRDLGLFPAGFEDGPAAQDHANPDLFHRPKRQAAPLIYNTIAKDRLPTTTQLMVARLGDRYLAAVPAEVTTVAGYRIGEAVRRGAAAGGDGAAEPLVIGVANGYLLYLTTPEEYALQYYEGGATLFGHQTLPVFSEHFEELAASISSGPPERKYFDPALARGHETELWPRRARRSRITRRILGDRCETDRVTVRWRDEPARELVPANGLLLRVVITRPAQPAAELWDDDPRVEVSNRSGGLFSRDDAWEVRLRVPATGRFRLTLLPRRSFAQLPIPALTHVFDCP